jgi:peroxiredoxin
MSKHGLQATMLSDADLAVIRQFGLENTATAMKRPGLVGLPIPTTILVDSEHIVRWIDQAADQQVRSAPHRVKAALVAALGPPITADIK